MEIGIVHYGNKKFEVQLDNRQFCITNNLEDAKHILALLRLSDSISLSLLATPVVTKKG